MKKSVTFIAFVCILCMALCTFASACTTLYTGSALTVDGGVYFSRSEDISNSYNKVMYVAPAGKHVAGEVYSGCYGFTYTFTKDSYSYTAFSDDNLLGICPDCGGEHEHTPYQAGGTNSMGVTMTATETLYGDDSADPCEDLGIEEAEIVTVILSESASAKEAVELLCSIYDTAGANCASGLIIADANEAWYMENLTGHTYVAVKCAPGTVFTEPNTSIIGAIDLDDTENVIYSANLMEVAQATGNFVGDAEKNIINYADTFCGVQSANARMINALNWLNPSYAFGEDNMPEESVFQLTNVDENGEITAVKTGIVTEKVFGAAEFIDFYKISNIGYERNLETHIFGIKDASATGTVEWAAMDDASCNVFVPYYPLLTTDTAACLKVGTEPAGFVTEQPEGGAFYPTTKTVWTAEGRASVEGFVVLPEGWESSYYWCADALTNAVKFCGVSEETVVNVKAQLAEMQDSFFAQFDAATQEIAANPDGAAEIATAASMNMAEQAQAKLYELYVNLK